MTKFKKTVNVYNVSASDTVSVSIFGPVNKGSYFVFPLLISAFLLPLHNSRSASLPAPHLTHQRIAGPVFTKNGYNILAWQLSANSLNSATNLLCSA